MMGSAVMIKNSTQRFSSTTLIIPVPTIKNIQQYWTKGQGQNLMKMDVPLCKSTVSDVYQEVMDDVINNVRELFLEDGVNEEVLQKLTQTWKTKFLETNVVESETDSKMDLPKVDDAANRANGLLHTELLAEIQKAMMGRDVKHKMVHINLMLPCKVGTEGGTRLLPFEVPMRAFAENRIFQVLNESVVTAAWSLPIDLATVMFQKHVNAVLNIQPQDFTLGTIDNGDNGSSSSSMPHQKVNEVVDTLDDESDYHDVLEESVVDVTDSEEDEMNGDVLEEPLGSDDDGSIPDAESTYENVIYCKYEKILNSGNRKWKFLFKHGIMKLDGQEYVFQNANGAAQF